MEHDALPGASPVAVRGAARPRQMASVANVRVASPKEAPELGVAPVDERLLLRRLLLARELIAKADHHAGEVAEAAGVLSSAAGALVLAPQPLGGVTQKGVDVLGELDVLERAAHLQHRAPLLL